MPAQHEQLIRHVVNTLEIDHSPVNRTWILLSNMNNSRNNKHIVNEYAQNKKQKATKAPLLFKYRVSNLPGV